MREDDRPFIAGSSLLFTAKSSNGRNPRYHLTLFCLYPTITRGVIETKLLPKRDLTQILYSLLKAAAWHKYI